jgi:hypothetical protein
LERAQHRVAANAPGAEFFQQFDGFNRCHVATVAQLPPPVTRETKRVGKEDVDTRRLSADASIVSMKAKPLFCLVITFVLMLARAEAQEALTNLQGILVTNQVEIPPGWSTIANPFSRSSLYPDGHLATDNRVLTLFPRMPVGTKLCRFDLQTEQYSMNVFGRHGWRSPNEVLNPGDGALIFNPTRHTLVVDFCTGFWQNGVSLNLPRGWSLVSCPQIDFHPAQPAPPNGWFPIYPTSLDSFDFPPPYGVYPRPLFAYSFFPQDGDIVYTLNRTTREFERHTYRAASGWDSIPVVADTESFFVHTKHPRQIGLYTSGYAW